MIPFEIWMDHILPFLPSEGCNLRLGMTARWFQYYFKARDEGEELPRIGRIATIWDTYRRGGYESIHLPLKDGLLRLNEKPFFIDTKLNLERAVRSLKPVFHFQVDFKQVFHEMIDKVHTTPLKRFSFFHNYTKTTDNTFIIKYSISGLIVDASEKKSPQFLVGWCSKAGKKGPMLFGALHENEYEITAGLSGNCIYPPPIMYVETDPIPYFQTFEWDFVKKETVQIVLFGVYPLD